MEEISAWFHSLKNTTQIDEIIFKFLKIIITSLKEFVNWFILLSTNQKIIIVVAIATLILLSRFSVAYLKKMFIKINIKKKTNILQIRPNKNDIKNSIYNPKEFRSKK